MMDELKVCPFCGDDGSLFLTEPLNPDEYGVMCNKCGATGGLDEDGEVAMNLWNTRPTEDALRAENETLKGKVAALENDMPLQKACEEIERLKDELDTQHELIGSSAIAIFGEYHDMRQENTRLKATVAELEKYISDHSEKE